MEGETLVSDEVGEVKTFLSEVAVSLTTGLMAAINRRYRF